MNTSPTLSVHIQAAMEVLRPGQAMLRGTPDDIGERLQTFAPEVGVVATPAEVKVSFDHAAILYHALHDKLVQEGDLDSLVIPPLKGSKAELQYFQTVAKVVTSLFMCLTWDRTLIAVAPALAARYANRAFAKGEDFADLFAVARQTHYLVVQGEVLGAPFDGLWIYRDVHPDTGVVHMFVQPVVLGSDTPDVAQPSAGAQAFLAFPMAASWDESAEKLAERMASEAIEAGVVNDAIATRALARATVAAWEPVVAMVHAVLVGAEGGELVKAVKVAPRNDAGFATVFAGENAKGQLEFSVWPVSSAPTGTARRQPGLSALN